jgi:hypothetical protein
VCRIVDNGMLRAGDRAQSCSTCQNRLLMATLIIGPSGHARDASDKTELIRALGRLSEAPDAGERTWGVEILLDADLKRGLSRLSSGRHGAMACPALTGTVPRPALARSG